MVMCIVTFFFKQKTAYEMRISDWSSDVCSSDLIGVLDDEHGHSGIGDMRLSAARCDDSGACLRTMLQLPTGDADHLMGGGLGLAAWYEQAFAFSALGPWSGSLAGGISGVHGDGPLDEQQIGRAHV